MLAGSLAAVVSQLLVRTADGQGRCAVNEILVSGTGLGNAIREGNINMIKSFIQSGGAKGMQLMDDALDKLCQAGKLDNEDAYLKATDKQRFQKYLKPQMAAVR